MYAEKDLIKSLNYLEKGHLGVSRKKVYQLKTFLISFKSMAFSNLCDIEILRKSLLPSDAILKFNLDTGSGTAKLPDVSISFDLLLRLFDEVEVRRISEVME